MQLPTPKQLCILHIIHPVGAMDTCLSSLNLKFFLLCLCLILYKRPSIYGLVERQIPNNAIKKKIGKEETANTMDTFIQFLPRNIKMSDCFNAAPSNFPLLLVCA